jgi:exodeoxyribonuclease V gamma subunit
MTRDIKRSKVIHVWYSNQLERLADRLIENLGKSKDSPASRLFAMPTIIVPNQNVETYLKYEIARGLGIAAGLKFQMTEEFLENLLSRDGKEPSSKLVSSGMLRALFIDVLSDASHFRRALPDAVQNYIKSGGDEQDACDLRRFQLASRLARLSRQYGDTRPDWLRSWANGQTALNGDSMASTEEWQRDLWARLIEHVRARDKPDRNWILPFDLFAFLEQANCKWPDQVHLFGFSYIWHGLHNLVEQLKKNCCLHIYTLAPFAQFTTDIAPTNQDSQSRRRSARRSAGTKSKTSVEDWISPIEFSIVKQWGRPSHEYFEMLSKITDAEFHPDFLPDEPSTVLRHLQREILQQSLQPDQLAERDGSLSILGSPGIRREAEVVANEIWKLIAEDNQRSGSAGDRLRFCDIAVLLADRANQAAYQAHFRAVFDELHSIPYNIIDLPLAGECRVIEALLLLSALPMGKFTRPELLKILVHPAVRARFLAANVNRWRDWCLGLEIVRGADHLDHDDTYIDRELFHWEQGLRRLVLGAFMAGPRSDEERVYRLGDVEYLPYEQPTDALADMGRLIMLVRSLVADARFAQSAQLTMTQWSAFFVSMVNAYLAADSESEQRALSQCLQRIQGLCESDVAGQTVSYRIAYESLKEAINGLTGARGHYLADGVVVSPILEMRSLPFRVVFLCGLGEGRFPAADGPDPLDLTLVHRHLGDVSPRERDRYLFLETLVCARDRLYLSYVARDAQTGDELEPSPLIHELSGYLNRSRPGLLSQVKVEKQPLHRFDKVYFDDVSSGRPGTLIPPNFSLSARNEWSAREIRRLAANDALSHLSVDSLRNLDPRLFDLLRLCPIENTGAATPAPQRVIITLRDLLGFLKCPLQGWAQRILRLREDEEEDEAAREDEPFITGRLGETMLLREVFFDALGGTIQPRASGDFDRLYALHVESRLRRGQMPVGLFGQAERHRHLTCLTGWHESARRRDLIDRSPFHVYRFGHASEDERVDRIEGPIILQVPVGTPGQLVRVEVHGRTDLVASQLPGSITPVIRDQATQKDFLAGFLDAVVLSLLPGRQLTDEYHAHVIPGSVKSDPSLSHRLFRGINAARARQFLTELLADLLGGSHAYLLPCEAVFDHLAGKNSIESAVRDMKEDDQKPCSSRYGPVPNFEQYDAPDEDEARRMIERRFGLFVESGGLGE